MISPTKPSPQPAPPRMTAAEFYQRWIERRPSMTRIFSLGFMCHFAEEYSAELLKQLTKSHIGIGAAGATDAVRLPQVSGAES